jgi:hypothetical protein
LKHTRNLVGTRIRVEDFPTEIRRIPSGLTTCLKEAKKRGLEPFLKRDKLVVKGRTYDVGCLREIIQMEVASRGVDTPDGSRLNEFKELGQQNTGKEVIQDCSWDRVRGEDTMISREEGRSDVLEG